MTRLSALLALALLGCTSYVPITVEMMEKAHFTSDDLRYVQFFVDRDMVLERKLKPSEHQGAREGGIGIFVEQVVVDEKTPGVAEEVEQKKLENEKIRYVLWVSFEAGTRFPFVAEGSGGFNLDATDRRLVLGEKMYDVTWEGTGRPLLLIEENEGIDLRKLRGRRLTD